MWRKGRRCGRVSSSSGGREGNGGVPWCVCVSPHLNPDAWCGVTASPWPWGPGGDAHGVDSNEGKEEIRDHEEISGKKIKRKRENTENGTKKKKKMKPRLDGAQPPLANPKWRRHL